MLVTISARIAPELPCADRMAAWTRASTRSGPASVAAAAMPSMVSRTLVPVSESATGKTFIASSAAADSPTTAADAPSQASNVAHERRRLRSDRARHAPNPIHRRPDRQGDDSTPCWRGSGTLVPVARTGMTNSDR